jgi:predicted NUDIX family NTP pyrophosphohydrolase
MRRSLPPLLFLLSAVVMFAPGCRSAGELPAARTHYPAHWWTPVSTNGAPAWEIFPQAAAPGEVILSKRHELGLLRAAFPGVIWTNTRAEVAQMTAFAAKNAGDVAERNMKTMGIDWVTFEGKRMEYRFAGRGDFYQLIVAATREKVGQNPDVQKVLLATGDLILKPDHHQETNAPAAWRYFKILTEIRTELQRERKK